MTPEHNDMVSVIIPVFNAERFVEESLRSALEQTYAPMEVIVVDDGSTDGTLDRVRKFADRVEVLRQENAGAFVARNAGAAKAKGAFLAFQDADDVWEPHKIERQMEVFRRHPEVDVVATWGAEIDENGRRISRGLKKPPVVFDEVVDLERTLLAYGNFVPLSTSVVRRHVFFEAGGFYTRERIISCDYELWIRLSERHLFFVISEPLVQYRVLEHSLLHGSPAKEYGAQLNILNMHRYRFSALGWRARLSRLYQAWADSALFEGHQDGWPMLRAALCKNPLNLGAWALGVRVVAGRVLRRVRRVSPH